MVAPENSLADAKLDRTFAVSLVSSQPLAGECCDDLLNSPSIRAPWALFAVIFLGEEFVETTIQSIAARWGER